MAVGFIHPIWKVRCGTNSWHPRENNTLPPKLFSLDHDKGWFLISHHSLSEQRQIIVIKSMLLIVAIFGLSYNYYNYLSLQGFVYVWREVGGYCAWTDLQTEQGIKRLPEKMILNVYNIIHNMCFHQAPWQQKGRRCPVLLNVGYFVLDLINAHLYLIILF